MSAYIDYIYNKFTNNIASWDESLRSDVYALVIFIEEGFSGSDASGSCVHFDGVVTLAYSTTSHLEELAKQPHLSVSKWWGNYQMGKPPVQIPQITWQTDPNPEEFALRDAWLASFGVSTDSPDYKKHIITACQGVIQRMHDSGFIQKTFGRPIPVLVAGDEAMIQYEATVAANPQDAIVEFIASRE